MLELFKDFLLKCKEFVFSKIIDTKRYCMEINIHIEAKKLDKNLKLAIEEYVKRTSPYCRINIKLYKSLEKLTMKAGSKAYQIVPGNNSPSSPELAQLINKLNVNGFSCIEFIIANSEEAPNITEHELEEFNLSSFTMSPDLTTVVLTEQIYRAYTIMNNITYHK